MYFPLNYNFVSYILLHYHLQSWFFDPCPVDSQYNTFFSFYLWVLTTVLGYGLMVHHGFFVHTCGFYLHPQVLHLGWVQVDRLEVWYVLARPIVYSWLTLQVLYLNSTSEVGSGRGVFDILLKAGGDLCSPWRSFHSDKHEKKSWMKLKERFHDGGSYLLVNAIKAHHPKAQLLIGVKIQ